MVGWEVGGDGVLGDWLLRGGVSDDAVCGFVGAGEVVGLVETSH